MTEGNTMKYDDKWGEFYRVNTTGDNIKGLKSNLHTCFCMSGRTAMDLIIKDIKKKHPKISTVSVPLYCSHSMLEPIVLNDLTLSFYNVSYSENKLYIDYMNQINDCLLIMDYFGFTTSEVIHILKEARKKGTIIIIDTTQCYLCDIDYDELADYTLTSYRKWFASSTARAYSSKEFLDIPFQEVNLFYENIRKEAFFLLGKANQEAYIKGRELLSRSEQMLAQDYSMKFSSPSEINYVNMFNYENMKKKRIENAKYLINGLKNYYPYIIPIFQEVKESDCPLCVPILFSSDRRELMDYLIKKGFDCTYHWNISQLHSPDCVNSKLYKDELSLACDQRINIEDLRQLLICIQQYIEKNMIRKYC